MSSVFLTSSLVLEQRVDIMRSINAGRNNLKTNLGELPIGDGHKIIRSNAQSILNIADEVLEPSSAFNHQKLLENLLESITKMNKTLQDCMQSAKSSKYKQPVTTLSLKELVAAVQKHNAESIIPDSIMEIIKRVSSEDSQTSLRLPAPIFGIKTDPN